MQRRVAQRSEIDEGRLPGGRVQSQRQIDATVVCAISALSIDDQENFPANSFLAVRRCAVVRRTKASSRSVVVVGAQ